MSTEVEDLIQSIESINDDSVTKQSSQHVAEQSTSGRSDMVYKASPNFLPTSARFPLPLLLSSHRLCYNERLRFAFDLIIDLDRVR